LREEKQIAETCNPSAGGTLQVMLCFESIFGANRETGYRRGFQEDAAVYKDISTLHPFP
jgi:hypothetical protein